MKQKAGCAPHCDFLFVNMTKLGSGLSGEEQCVNWGARSHAIAVSKGSA